MAADLKLLHPSTRKKCEKFIRMAIAAGLRIRITEGWRTEAYQNGLYAKGRTAPGTIVTNAKYPSSPHCWGVAFDIAILTNKNGVEWSIVADTDGDGINDWTELRDIGYACGLYWGGDWKRFVDRPHFEDMDFMPNNSVRMLKDRYGTPAKFKSTWPTYVPDAVVPTYPPVKIDVNQKLMIDGIIIDNMSYAPVRTIGEALGAAIGWNDKTKRATINGIEVNSLLVGSTSYMLVRPFAESLGAVVSWNESTRVVHIKK